VCRWKSKELGKKKNQENKFKLLLLNQSVQLARLLQRVRHQQHLLESLKVTVLLCFFNYLSFISSAVAVVTQ
jgi:hypothetical protein